MNQDKKKGLALSKIMEICGSILFYLVLLDVAVETFLSGSPLRWRVAAAVVVYFAITVGIWRGLPSVWRRFSWPSRLAASFFVLLGLMVFSVWIPGGMEQGIRMVGLSTPRVLCLVAAAAIALAATVLVRSPLVPKPGKWVIAGLSVYGLAAVIMGAWNQIAYRQLLLGKSFIVRLPFWLQGTFIGLLVIVPVSFAVGGIGLVLRRTTPGWRSRRVWVQSGLLVAALNLAVSGLIPPSVQTRSGSDNLTSRSALSLPVEAELKSGGSIETPVPRTPERPPENIASEIDRILQQIPETQFDPAAFGRALGAGVEPAFFYVRDHIRYEAYSGVLRGAKCAYWTGAANSFDRSLLLAELLNGKGIATRFAAGKLSRGQCEKLFDHIFDAPRASIAETESPGANLFKEQSDQFSRSVQARARRDYAAIRRALGNSLPTLKQSRDDILKDMEMHLWVQAEVNGQWIDLDSSFPDAEPGKSTCGLDTTFAKIPDEFHQRVTLRVQSEWLSGEELSQETVLRAAFNAEFLHDRPTFLIHIAASGAGSALLGSSGGQGEWKPALLVGGELHIGEAVSLGGAKSEGGGIGGLFGRAFSTPAEFVGESLEIEIAFPDGRREVCRRSLADRAGPGWRSSRPFDRAALRPLPSNADGPIAVQTIHNIWFSSGSHDAVAYFQNVRELSQIQPDDAQGRIFADISKVLPAQNLPLIIWTDQAVIPALNDKPMLRFYPDSPRVIIMSLGPDIKPGWSFLQVDLRRDRLRGISRREEAEGELTEHKLWYGALEGALEHEFIALQAICLSGEPTGVESTSQLLDADGAICIMPGDSQRVHELVSRTKTEARIKEALASGAVLVVPKAALHGDKTGWWQVRPGGDSEAVFEELNFADWRNPYANGAKGGVYLVDENTLRSKRISGNEYGTVTGEVAVKTIDKATIIKEVLWGIAGAAVVAAIVYGIVSKKK